LKALLAREAALISLESVRRQRDDIARAYALLAEKEAGAGLTRGEVARVNKARADRDVVEQTVAAAADVYAELKARNLRDVAAYQRGHAADMCEMVRTGWLGSWVASRGALRTRIEQSSPAVASWHEHCPPAVSVNAIPYAATQTPLHNPTPLSRHAKPHLLTPNQVASMALDHAAFCESDAVVWEVLAEGLGADLSKHGPDLAALVYDSLRSVSRSTRLLADES